MKRRRYHMTEEEANAVIAALGFVLAELRECEPLTPRELAEYERLQVLKNRLEVYQWWI